MSTGVPEANVSKEREGKLQVPLKFDDAIRLALQVKPEPRAVPPKRRRKNKRAKAHS